MEIVQDMKSVDEVVFNAYETPLKAMRRTQLWRLADIHGIEYPDQAPAIMMHKLLENAEAAGTAVLEPPKGMTKEQFLKLINGVERLPEAENKHRATGQTNVDRLMTILERMDAPEEPEPEMPSEAVQRIETMSMPDLRKVAKELGIPQKNTDKAADLRGKILGKDPA